MCPCSWKTMPTFLLGVWKYELSSKPESVLGVTLGTGIGGGFVYEGDLLRSKRGATLEIGHMVIEAEGPACTCGSMAAWSHWQAVGL